MTLVPLVHDKKSEKFTGTNFKWWQQKILFYMTTFKQARYLREDVPVISQNEINKEKRVAYNVWGHSYFLC